VRLCKYKTWYIISKYMDYSSSWNHFTILIRSNSSQFSQYYLSVVIKLNLNVTVVVLPYNLSICSVIFNWIPYKWTEDDNLNYHHLILNEVNSNSLLWSSNTKRAIIYCLTHVCTCLWVPLFLSMVHPWRVLLLISGTSLLLKQLMMKQIRYFFMYHAHN
jgi:hypothetical protein